MEQLKLPEHLRRKPITRRYSLRPGTCIGDGVDGVEVVLFVRFLQVCGTFLRATSAEPQVLWSTTRRAGRYPD